MKPLLFVLLAAAALPPLANAQGYFPRHNLTVGLGIAVPQEDLQPYFRNAFGWNIGYGYRFHRYFQADGGFESSCKAADVNDFYNTPNFGPLRIRDFQYFVPFGARVILPLAGERVRIYGGGGGAYLRYSELLRQPSDYFRVECPVCTARDGWGSYAMAGADFALDRSGIFRLGVMTRMYRANTEGDGLGALPPVRTSDRWWNSYLQFTFGF